MSADAYAGTCDRCGDLYISRDVRAMLCPSCLLGALTPAERGRLLGHVAKTGRRI